jgi:hypothetical protein
LDAAAGSTAGGRNYFANFFSDGKDFIECASAGIKVDHQIVRRIEIL